MFFFPVAGTERRGRVLQGPPTGRIEDGTREHHSSSLITGGGGEGGSSIEHPATSVGRMDGSVEVGENAARGQGCAMDGASKREQPQRSRNRLP